MSITNCSIECHMSQDPQEKLSTLASICLQLVPSYPVIFIPGCQTSILISRLIMMNPTHIYIDLDRDRIIKRIPIPVPGYPTCALQDVRHKVKL